MRPDRPPSHPGFQAAATIVYWLLCAAALGIASWSMFGTSADDAGPDRVAYDDAALDPRAAEALTLLDFAWQEHLPRWTLEFRPDNGSTVRGYTWSSERRIEVFIDDDDSPERLARILAHELGHAVDVEHNDADKRRRWNDERGLVDIPWWPESGRRDFGTGAGDFAEVFAAWLIGDGDFRSEVGPPPDADDLALLRELVLGS